MVNKDFNSILQLIEEFPDEQSCIDHLTTLRWNGDVTSPFDDESKVYNCKGNRYKCKNTGKYFNVRTGTIFDNTKLPLQKWFLAIWLATSHKKGISSLQLSRDLDITQKSAWFMLQRIRACFGMDNGNKLTGTVELDETYVGGDPGNRHKSIRNDDSKETREKYSKTVVFGMVERKGSVKAKIVEHASLYHLEPEIYNNISRDAQVYSDSWSSYSSLKLDFKHDVINHSKEDYVKGDIYTNTIEGFWSLLKRGVYGIYHHVSKKHLQFYIDEFCFRYNTRGISEAARFNLFLQRMSNRVKYHKLIEDVVIYYGDGREYYISGWHRGL